MVPTGLFSFVIDAQADGDVLKNIKGGMLDQGKIQGGVIFTRPA